MAWLVIAALLGAAATLVSEEIRPALQQTAGLLAVAGLAGLLLVG